MPLKGQITPRIHCNSFNDNDLSLIFGKIRSDFFRGILRKLLVKNFKSRSFMDEIIAEISEYYLDKHTEEFLKREFIKPFPFI